MKTFQELIASAPHIIKRKLEQLKFLRERPDFHPEPSAFHHIQIVTERVMQTGDINLVLAGILHDICKLDTVRMNEKTGWPTSPGHEDAAFELIQNNASVEVWILKNGGDLTKVAEICRHHMRFHQLGQMRPVKRDKWIATWTELGIWDQLQIFGAADNMIEDFDLNNLEKSWKWKREQ
jgi:hypothetical protein